MAVTENITSAIHQGRPAQAWNSVNTAERSRLPLPALLYLLAILLPIGFWAGPLSMTTLRMFVMIMVIPLIIRLFMGHFGKVIITDILFMLHILWAGIAIGVNNPDRVVEQVGSVGIEFLGGYFVGRAYIRTPEAFFALCRFLIFAVLCILPFGLYESMTGRPLIVEYLHKLPGLNSVPVIDIGKRMQLERVQSVFAHPIHHGLFCSVAFSLCFVALKGRMSMGTRFVISSLITLNGFLALSSGALTAIAMQFALIIWAAMFRNYKHRWWLLVGLFVSVYVIVDLLSTRSPLEVFMSYATFSTHNAYWRAIIFDWGVANVLGSAEKGIVGSPIFGLGLNAWIRPSFMHSGSIDNFWLVIAVRYGVPGLVFLVVGYVVVIARVMRRNFETDRLLTLIRRSWVFTFLGLSFTLCTVHVWTNIYSFIFFMFGAGVWLMTVQPSDSSAQNDAASEPQGKQSTGTQYTRPVAAVHSPQTTRYSRFNSNDKNDGAETPS